MQPKKYYRSKNVMIAREKFHKTCPGNIYFTVSDPREDGSFTVEGAVHCFLGDGIGDDYIKFDKDVNIIEIGKR
jgi:hypothetical protein